MRLPSVVAVWCVAASSVLLAAQRTPIPGAAGTEPSPLLFHEAWTRAPLTQPMVQANLGNQQLTLHIYGNASEIRKTFHPVDDYTYTGETTSNWAVTVSDKSSAWDLSGTAKIRLKTQNTGYRVLHVVIKTTDGRYYVSEEGSPESSVWIEREYVFVRNAPYDRMDRAAFLRADFWKNHPRRDMLDCVPVNQTALAVFAGR